MEYVYLLQEREFIKLQENVYKLGKTKQENLCRFYQYPKGSRLIIQTSCYDCHKLEQQLLELFRTEFVQRTDIGSEYFEGNPIKMKEIINKEEALTSQMHLNLSTTKRTSKNAQTHEVQTKEAINEKIQTEKPCCGEAQNEKTFKTKTIMNLNAYVCENCQIETNHKHNFLKHCKSLKHLQACAKETPILLEYVSCKYCEKTFASQSGQWKHEQMCCQNPHNVKLLQKLKKQFKKTKQ